MGFDTFGRQISGQRETGIKEDAMTREEWKDAKVRFFEKAGLPLLDRGIHGAQDIRGRKITFYGKTDDGDVCVFELVVSGIRYKSYRQSGVTTFAILTTTPQEHSSLFVEFNSATNTWQVFSGGKIFKGSISLD